MHKILFFDTETTGFPKSLAANLNDQPYVIELYMEMHRNGECIKTYESFFKVPIPLPDEIKKITHIDDEMLKESPTFAEKAGEILEIIKSADRVVAHNLSFDKAMLAIEYKRLGMKNPFSHIKPQENVCTIMKTNHVRGYRLSLSKLYEHLFKRQFPGAHRASSDVKALVECYYELKSRGFVN